MISLLQDQENMSFDEVCLGPYMPSFEEFWALYHSQSKKKARKAAERAWFKLSFIDHGLIMAHLPERVTSDQQWLKGFQPHAATFLNGELWEDEYETSRPDNGKPAVESIGSRLSRT